jgi:hypothetical protein
MAFSNLHLKKSKQNGAFFKSPSLELLILHYFVVHEDLYTLILYVFGTAKTVEHDLQMVEK